MFCLSNDARFLQSNRGRFKMKNEEIIEKILEHKPDYTTSRKRDLISAVEKALSLKDKEFQKKIDELKEENVNKTGKTLIIPMEKFNKLAGEDLK